MNEEVHLHIENAENCVVQAELLLAASHPGAAISRAYYAMFHAATAALLHEGIERHSHQGIIAAFGQTFARSARVDPRLHRHLKETFDLRQDSDYLPAVQLTDERAQEVLGWAREFVAVCRQLCE